MPSSTKPGTMGAYKPRNPEADGDLYVSSADRKKMQAQKDEEITRKKTAAAYDAAVTTYKNGGMVGAPARTVKCKPYKVGK